MVEMAGYVNSRNHIIAALAMLLALSVVTNVVFLVARRLSPQRAVDREIRRSLSDAGLDDSARSERPCLAPTGSASVTVSGLRSPEATRARRRASGGRRVDAQFLLKSNERRNSLPSGSFRNLTWQAGQRSNRKPL